MSKIAELVRPAPNAELVASLKTLLDEAERGEFIGAMIVMLRPNNMFGVRSIGRTSNLEMAGALAFAQHDLIVASGDGK